MVSVVNYGKYINEKKQRIAVIGPNPIQSNPWMDPIHVQLWCGPEKLDRQRFGDS